MVKVLLLTVTILNCCKGRKERIAHGERRSSGSEAMHGFPTETSTMTWIWKQTGAKQAKHRHISSHPIRQCAAVF